MPEIKGTDVVILRKMVREKGNSIEECLLAELSDEEKEAYLSIMPISWTPVDIQARIYQVAANVLYPSQLDNIIKLHLEIAKRSYSDLYKIFLSIPSVQFIIKRAAKIWRTYYNTGVATIENITSSTLDFVVTDFPELPLAMREATNAHIMYIVQVAGKKNVTVKRNDKNQEKWIWHTTWKN